MQDGLSYAIDGSWSNASVQKKLNLFFIFRLKSRLHNGLQHSRPVRVSTRLEETDNHREWVSSAYTQYGLAVFVSHREVFRPNFYPVRMRKGLSNWFCPSIHLS